MGYSEFRRTQNYAKIIDNRKIEAAKIGDNLLRINEFPIGNNTSSLLKSMQKIIDQKKDDAVNCVDEIFK